MLRFQPQDAERFAAVLRRFDEENSEDPNLEKAGDAMVPRELLYSQWLTNR
jgi:hypothetical protein